ncbi:SH3 domain-containing protein [Brevibacillus reuszeri]|uniref:SH3 domain-containing protein n=1 Tax=Brevibacillus reuszeri TaxID=54915 RepID=UPI00289EBCEF|nr:SH3 domain-containing protein [Brevibacillus reuszeri]
MIISSYQKSLWVRNALLVLCSLAFLAVLAKAGLSYQKVTLYEKAHASYSAHDLIKAEELFAKAADITVISYGDEQWNSLMQELTATRQEMESIQLQARSAISQKQDAQVLETYERYQAMRQKYTQQGEQAAFFQQLSSHLGMEKEWADYYTAALQEAKDQSKANLAQESYQNETFIRTLVTIPDEYFGGGQQKQSELASLFQHYEKTKLRSLTSSAPFEDVVARTAKSLRIYREIGMNADWLISQLEKYAQGEINLSIRQKDLTAFISQSIAYRKIEDVLPRDSSVLAAITRHLESRVKQAEQYIQSRQFTKATRLYQELNALMDTTSLIATAEERWLDYDPTRLLNVKYPDKKFRSVFTGTDRWGTKLYAFGLEESEQRLYFAAKKEDDSLTYLELGLDDVDMKSAKISLSDLLGNKEAPLIMIEAAGKERPFSYTGLLPVPSENVIHKRFAIESDEFSIEDSTHIIVKNARGKGEQEFALFQLDDTGLVYDRKIADTVTSSEEEATDPEQSNQGEYPSDLPPDIPYEQSGQKPHKIAVYAGPGEEYDRVGQISSNSSIQVVTDLNGWYQIIFAGKEGWIRAPQPAP